MTLTDNEARELFRKCEIELREFFAFDKFDFTNEKPDFTNDKSNFANVKLISQMRNLDPRIVAYAEDCVREGQRTHNLDELLALRKFVRIMATYPMNVEKVQMVFKAFESLSFSGLKGRQHYPLTPIQCVMLASVFGPMRSKEDWRRLVTEATYFIPRKFCKTTMSAFFALWFFMFEDYNAEVYCTANSANQSAILYKMAKELISQLDPEEKRIRQTKTVCEWKDGQPRAAKLEALSAGGKTKDGLFAALCLADEYGSAPYVNGNSDMGRLVSVVEGSMGPRREPLTLITTTAGRIAAGPFRDKLDSLIDVLQREMQVPLDGQPHPLDTDWQYAMILHPNQWQRDEESLRDPDVWRMVNPHIGITVQPEYYAEAWRKMELDDETKRENICKLFNIYASTRAQTWIKPDEVRALQVSDRTIDQCTEDDGWRVFVGLDFSMGNDLHAATYLAFREADDGGVEFFADLDAWISEQTLTTTPLRTLYSRWIESGHLHVSPGATLQPSLPVERIAQLYDRGVTFLGFGYDPYKAKTPINDLAAWLFEVTGDASAPQQYIVPVRQNYASYNPVVEELDYLLRSDPARLHLSASPLWPWEFGNVALDVSTDGMENKKPVKANPGSESCKVDNVQCLCSALMLFDRACGQQERK